MRDQNARAPPPLRVRPIPVQGGSFSKPSAIRRVAHLGLAAHAPAGVVRGA